MKKLKELEAINVESWIKENPAKCPLSCEDCETAATHAYNAKKQSIESEKAKLIEANKTELQNGYYLYASKTQKENQAVDSVIENINKVKAKNEIINNHNKEIDKIKNNDKEQNKTI